MTAVKDMQLKIEDVEFWGEHQTNKGGMRISWSGTIGFGQLDIFKGNDGKLCVATECMSTDEDKEFVEELLKLLSAELKVIE